MPEVDLETFVSSVCAGSSDRKIACETTSNNPSNHDPETRPGSSPNDYPPESYFLSTDAKLEWLNDNAFFERKDSQRGNSAQFNSNLNSNPNSNPSSQRFLLKSKASIIGLPKPQKTCFDEVKKRRVNKTRVVLKRVGSRIKTDPSIREPSSPMVSCIGRVRSKRDRSNRIRRQKSGRSDPFNEKQNRVKKTGFLASLKAIFRIGDGGRDISASGSHAPMRTHDIRSRLPVTRSFDDGESVMPGLGRFTSGRRGDLLRNADVA